MSEASSSSIHPARRVAVIVVTAAVLGVGLVALPVGPSSSSGPHLTHDSNVIEPDQIP